MSNEKTTDSEGSANRRSVSLGKHYLSVAFLLAGAVVFTYAATRTWTTEYALTRARDHVRAYLEAKNLCIGVSNRDLPIPVETDTESRQLLGRVAESGGQYYWWNEAALFWGLGIFLFSIGLLIPFHRRGGLRQEFRQFVRAKYEGRCRQCGYDLQASKGVCPECGRKIDQKPATEGASQYEARIGKDE